MQHTDVHACRCRREYIHTPLAQAVMHALLQKQSNYTLCGKCDPKLLGSLGHLREAAGWLTWPTSKPTLGVQHGCLCTRFELLADAASAPSGLKPAASRRAARDDQ